tara:strand:+ start:510 stop:695 length:186 start_codon:yes stop_codon:yes gene_type:complete
VVEVAEIGIKLLVNLVVDLVVAVEDQMVHQTMQQQEALTLEAAVVEVVLVVVEVDLQVDPV